MAKLRETIAELSPSLASDTRLRAVIADEITVLRNKYADERVTQIVNDPGELGVEDLIQDEEIVLTLTRAGYIKSVATTPFARRAAVVAVCRVRSCATRTSSIRSFTPTTLAHLLLFSNRGRVFRLRGHEIPMKERTAKGTAVVNLLNLQPTSRSRPS